MTEITITPKQHSTTIYYMFRDNGQEVTIDTTKPPYSSSHKLTKEQIKFIIENIV